MKKVALVIAAAAFVLVAACSNPASGSSNSNNSNGTGNTGGNNNNNNSSTSSTNSSFSADIAGVAYSAGPYSYCLDMSGGNFVYYAEKTLGTTSTGVWYIESTGQITGNGQYSINSSLPLVAYVNSSGSEFVLTNGTVVVTGYPNGTGYFTGTFSGTGYWVTASGMTTVSCTNGAFNIYHP